MKAPPDLLLPKPGSRIVLVSADARAWPNPGSRCGLNRRSRVPTVAHGRFGGCQINTTGQSFAAILQPLMPFWHLNLQRGSAVVPRPSEK